MTGNGLTRRIPPMHTHSPECGRRNGSLTRPLAIILIHCLALSSVLGQRTTRLYYNPETEPPERLVDMQHMRIEVSFAPEKGLVRGRVTHFFVPLRERVDSLFLNGPGIEVHSAAINGKPLPFRLSEDGVTLFFAPPLQWEELDSLQLTYEAHPRRGIYFVGWNDPTNRSRKQIWTQGQGIDNRNWIPCSDQQNDKLTTETIVTFDAEYQVLSNGTKVMERENPDGTKTWHYRMTHPHVTYLVMLGIGKYGIDSRVSDSGVPVHLWYYPDEQDRVAPTYRYSTESLDFVARHTGVPYPWESYSQIPVQDFLYGAMENTTATVFGDFYYVDRRAFLDQDYIYVNVHELTHQWFGDFVTGRNGVSSWLQESFATFYPKLFMREVFGEEMYEWRRRTEQEAALTASTKDRYPIVHPRAGTDRVYSKGSTVLDMMMYVWGEESYRRVIRHYLTQHAYGNVETNDLYQAFQDVLGVTPNWFFEEWLYRGGEPHYSVSVRETMLPGRAGKSTEITVRQVHPTDDLVGLFTMPIVLEVHYSDGSRDSVRVLVTEAFKVVTIPNPGARSIDFVLFDPGSKILKSLTFDRTFEQLQAQARRAPHMIDRYDAIVAMRAIAPARKRTLYASLFTRERFFAPRVEIIQQIAADTSRESRALLRKALGDSAQQVRLAAVNALETIPPGFKQNFETLLTDSSYAVVEAVLRKLAAQFPEILPSYLRQTRSTGGIGSSVKVAWHELNAAGGDRSSLDTLVDLSGRSYEFRTRINAFKALQRLNYLDERVIGTLFDAIAYWNPRLSGPAADVAEYFAMQAAYGQKIRDYYRSHTWTSQQQSALKRIIQ